MNKKKLYYDNVDSDIRTSVIKKITFSPSRMYRGLRLWFAGGLKCPSTSIIHVGLLGLVRGVMSREMWPTSAKYPRWSDSLAFHNVNLKSAKPKREHRDLLNAN